VINQNTGAARAIGNAPFTPAVEGNLEGFDFNPTVDRIRVITNTGQNLRLNPETGMVVAVDGNLSGGASSAAYTNNTAGANTTALYTINSPAQQLNLVTSPNDGTLVPVGNLNLNISGEGGFDIDAKTGTALGLYTVQGQGGKSSLFTVDLSTGAARVLAEYDPVLNYSAIAIPTQPVAYVFSFFTTSGFYIINPTNPSAVVTKPFIGLEPLDRLLGLDFRPATGQLYAMVGRDRGNNTGMTGETRLFTINPATGEASFVTRVNNQYPGAPYGFDFDPVTDEIRVTGGNQQSRIHPTTGVVVRETDLTPNGPTITALAYTNNVAGASTTTLYGLGSTFVTGASNLNLYRLNQPNAGRLQVVGSVGTNDDLQSPYVESFAGFDIGGVSGTAYALGMVRNGASSNVYSNRVFTIDLNTGRATAIGDLSGIPVFPMTGFAVGLGF
jgi:hypothetical protein